MQTKLYPSSMSIFGNPTTSGSFDITAYVSNDWGEDTKILTLYIAPADEVVSVDAEHFPDSVFRQYILDNYDTNGNNILDEAEVLAAEKFPADFTYSADAVNGITITSNETLNITDLTGIEYFTNLKTVYISPSVRSVDLSANVSLDALIIDGAELENLDLTQNLQLRVLKITNTPMQEPCIARPIPELHMLQYLDISSSDLTQLNLDDNTSLDYVACSPQHHSGTLSTDTAAEYPYSFNFRTIVSEDNLSRIIPDSIQILDENGKAITDYIADNWIYHFKQPPHIIKYKYNIGVQDIAMEVTITMKIVPDCPSEIHVQQQGHSRRQNRHSIQS